MWAWAQLKKAEKDGKNDEVQRFDIQNKFKKNA